MKVAFSWIFCVVSKTTTWWWDAWSNYAGGTWKKWKYEDEAELLLYQLPTCPCLESRLQSSWALILSLRENQQQQKVRKVDDVKESCLNVVFKVTIEMNAFDVGRAHKQHYMR